MKRSVKGIIQSARLGMAPTLLTNAMVAWACVYFHRPFGGQWYELALVVLMGLCFFLYGMWENDRVDARWDGKHRPNRPVPRGDVSVWTLRLASLAAGLTGLVLSAFLSGSPLPGALLLIVITLYNWLHKAFGFSIILMGTCRGIWVMLAAMSAYMFTGAGIGSFAEGMGDTAHYYAYSLTFYTIIASWIARGEAHNPKRKAVAGFLLSGMSLHDTVWLLCLGQYLLAAIAVACYGASLVLRKLKQRTT